MFFNWCHKSAQSGRTGGKGRRPIDWAEKRREDERVGRGRGRVERSHKRGNSSTVTPWKKVEFFTGYGKWWWAPFISSILKHSSTKENPDSEFTHSNRLTTSSICFQCDARDTVKHLARRRVKPFDPQLVCSTFFFSFPSSQPLTFFSL